MTEPAQKLEHTAGNLKPIIPQAVAVSAGDLITMEMPARRLLLAPWLPAQGLAMVYAPRGVGKTYFALNVAYAVASGGQYLNWSAPACGRVLYLDGEMPANVMQQRLRDIVATAEKDAASDALRIVTPDLQGDQFMPDLSSATGQASLESLLEGTDLVVVDNISTLCRGGIENESESWLPVQQWALRLRSKGITVLFVHHAGKGGNQRGTSRREDVLDTVISLKRPPDYSPDQGAAFEVHFEKNRGFTGTDAEPLDVSLANTPTGLTWVWRELEVSTYHKVVELAKEELSQADIARELDVNRSTVSRHIKAAKARGVIQ
tara:strand:+ start:2254 stop:3210 length:957 start_codon:yes stop_codon:yes gene_type:complete